MRISSDELSQVFIIQSKDFPKTLIRAESVAKKRIKRALVCNDNTRQSQFIRRHYRNESPVSYHTRSADISDYFNFLLNKLVKRQCP